MLEKSKEFKKKEVRYLHIAKAAKLLGYSESFIRSKCATGELLGHIVGGAWHVEEKSIEIYKSRQIRSRAKRITTLEIQGAAELRVRQEKILNAVRVVGREVKVYRKQRG